MDLKKITAFQQKIGYEYSDVSLLETALIHSSFANEHNLRKFQNNEKLEGTLSKTRASLVCEPALAYCARELELGNYLQLGKGEDMTGGRDRDSILSDALEAVIGSLYLDGGLESARQFIMNFVLNDMENTRLFHDCKTTLQENIQSWSKETPVYELVDVFGPEHNRTFVMQIRLGNRILGKGSGRTKQAAGQNAAYESLLALKAEGLFRDKDEDLCI